MGKSIYISEFLVLYKLLMGASVCVCVIQLLQSWVLIGYHSILYGN